MGELSGEAPPATTAKSTGMNFREKLKNRDYRRRLLHSMCFSLALFTLGTTESQAGPTFLDLQIITRTTVEQASVFFSAHSCGYMFGSALGGVLGKKVNSYLMMFLVMPTLGAILVATPYCSLYGLMVSVRVASGLVAGFVDVTTHSEIMKLWGNKGRVQMQLSHFSYALGGVLSPLFTEPFLAAKEATLLNTSHEESLKAFNETGELKDIMFVTDSSTPYESSTSPYPEMTRGWSVDVTSESTASTGLDRTGVTDSLNVMDVLNFTDLLNITDMLNVTDESPPPYMRTSNVGFAFMISGLICCLCSIPFLWLRLRQKDPIHSTTTEPQQPQPPKDSRQRILPRHIQIPMIMNLCLFYAFYVCIEDTFANFLMTFSVREFDHFTKSQGAYITAIFWASFAGSRFLMIFISQRLSAVRLLYLCFGVLAASFAGFSVVAFYGMTSVMTFFAALSAFGMSAVFPAGFSWSESEVMQIRRPILSCIFVSCSVASIVNPLIVAFLMREFSNMWFAYLVYIELLIALALFVFLLSFNRLYVNRHYGFLRNVDVRVDLEISGTINNREVESRTNTAGSV